MHRTDRWLSGSVFLFKTHTRKHKHMGWIPGCVGQALWISSEWWTWKVNLASSCWCEVSLHFPLRFYLQSGAGASIIRHFVTNQNSLVSFPFEFAFVCVPGSLCVCVNVCCVYNKHFLWALRLLKQGNGCADSWGIRQWLPLPPKCGDLHDAQSPAPVPSWTCTRMS